MRLKPIDVAQEMETLLSGPVEGYALGVSHQLITSPLMGSPFRQEPRVQTWLRHRLGHLSEWTHWKTRARQANEVPDGSPVSNLREFTPSQVRVNEQNQRVLEKWWKEGYLPMLPTVTPSKDINSFATVYVGNPLETSEVTLGLSPFGDSASFVDRSHSGARFWKNSSPTLRSLFVLAHEAGHLCLNSMETFFSPERYRPFFEPIVKELIFGPKGEIVSCVPEVSLNDRINCDLTSDTALGPHARLFHERYADCYAAMLLLRMTHFDPHAQMEVENIIELRAHHSRQHQSLRLDGLDTYATTDILKELLRRKAEWRELPNDQIRNFAQALVSDSLIDSWINCPFDPSFSGALTSGESHPGVSSMFKHIKSASYALIVGQQKEWLASHSEQFQASSMGKLISNAINSPTDKLEDKVSLARQMWAKVDTGIRSVAYQRDALTCGVYSLLCDHLHEDIKLAPALAEEQARYRETWAVINKAVLPLMEAVHNHVGPGAPPKIPSAYINGSSDEEETLLFLKGKSEYMAKLSVPRQNLGQALGIAPPSSNLSPTLSRPSCRYRG